MKLIWSDPALPFFFRALDHPGGTGDLPERLPFGLWLDCELGLLRQVVDENVEGIAARAYEQGSLIGNAIDDTPFGKSYASDFLSFIDEAVGSLKGLEVLEIGAGRGYFLALIRSRGARITGLEPGIGLAQHWRRHDVDIIADRFPSSRARGPYDMIVLFGVLEHVTDPAAFACGVIQHLKPGGSALFAVPNCGPAIEAADMSMLIHEHHSYFTERSLQRTLAAAGFAEVSIRQAGYGSVLYAHAQQVAAARPASLGHDELTGLLSFGERIKFGREIFRRRAHRATQTEGGLGIFCPARGLNILPSDENYRFFDDDRELHGKYYPGFAVPVESRQALSANPVGELWILSRSFGERIRTSLLDAGLAVPTIYTLDELLGPTNSESV